MKIKDEFWDVKITFASFVQRNYFDLIVFAPDYLGANVSLFFVKKRRVMVFQHQISLS